MGQINFKYSKSFLQFMQKVEKNPCFKKIHADLLCPSMIIVY